MFVIPRAAGPHVAHLRQHRARMRPGSEAERANLASCLAARLESLFLTSLIEVAYTDVAKEGDERPAQQASH